MKNYSIFALHLFSGTLATLMTGIMVRRAVMNLSQQLAGASLTFNVEISSFVPALVGVGLVAGYFTYSRFESKSAFWIFLIPASILIVRIITFPAPSIFSSGMMAGWNYYFGAARCSASNLLLLTDTAIQCQSRLLYLGTCVSAAAYSTGALVKSMRAFEFSREE
jgi:hypothetical protein